MNVVNQHSEHLVYLSSICRVVVMFSEPYPPTKDRTLDLNVLGNDNTISFTWNPPSVGFARGYLVSVTNFTSPTQPQPFIGTSTQIIDSRFNNGATYIIEIVSLSESVDTKADQQSEPLLWPIKTDVKGGELLQFGLMFVTSVFTIISIYTEQCC